MSIKSALIATTLSIASLTAQAAPVQLITNGGFETGNFSGWTTVNNGGSSGCGSNVWEVNATGHEGCGTMAKPISGTYAAYNTFDGTANPYTLSQQIVVPGSVLAATLSFMDEFSMSYSGTLRTFRVDFYDQANTTLLGNVLTQTVGTSQSQAWTTNSFDVTALLASQANKTITLRFTEIVPTAYTGPGNFGLDNISLQANVPEPGSLALLGLGVLGFAASRRKSAKKDQA